MYVSSTTMQYQEPSVTILSCHLSKNVITTTGKIGTDRRQIKKKEPFVPSEGLPPAKPFVVSSNFSICFHLPFFRVFNWAKYKLPLPVTAITWTLIASLWMRAWKREWRSKTDLLTSNYLHSKHKSIISTQSVPERALQRLTCCLHPYFMLCRSRARDELIPARAGEKQTTPLTSALKYRENAPFYHYHAGNHLKSSPF